MRRLDVHENIDVSDTKLILGLRVCFISPDLTVNKLFPINPRAITGPPKMSLLLEDESTSALIIEPRLILVAHFYKTYFLVVFRKSIRTYNLVCVSLYLIYDLWLRVTAWRLQFNFDRSCQTWRVTEFGHGSDPRERGHGQIFWG